MRAVKRRTAAACACAAVPATALPSPVTSIVRRVVAVAPSSS